MIDSKHVTINGSGGFTDNDTNGKNGGAISAIDTVKINGTIQFINDIAQTGLTFDANTATNGGAIFGNTIKISGSNVYIDDKDKETYANKFTRNEVTGNGGVIYASGNVSLSGSNLFRHNDSGSIGGAIFSDGSVLITGVNTFKLNFADDDGGAIWAKDDVTFSGKDTTTTFSENTADRKNNDVFSQEGNIAFNGGVHTLGGGLVANGKANDANTGIISVSGGALVHLEDGSISSAKNLTIDESSMLKIDLNANNKVSALNLTDITDGATELFLTGIGTIDDGVMDVFLKKTDVMTDGYYLVAAGDFSGQDINNKVLYNSQDYAESRISATDKGLYLGVLLDNGVVIRSDASGTLNMADTFDGAFEDGLGAVATGNVITIGADVNAQKKVSLGADVTELTIQSDDSAQQRIITATGTPKHRFLNFEGDTTVNTTNIIFQDGGNTNISGFTGGAIFSVGDLTVNGTAEVGGNATIFKNNKAEFGGALGAYNTDSESNITLGGNLDFDGNEAILYGGAVHSTGTVTLDGASIAFEKNTATSGGAIYTGDLVISGTDNSFTDNQAEDEGGAIYATGNVTFAEGSETVFSGNTMGNNNTPNDLFVSPNNDDSSIITIKKNATVDFGGGIVGEDDTSLVINEGANVGFKDGATLNIGGVTRIDSDNVTFSNSNDLVFQHGIVVGANVSQELKGNVTISEQLGVTFNPQNGSFSSIDLSGTSDLTISDGTSVKIYDAAGNAMSAADFKGTTARQTLIFGNGDVLAKVGGADSYESLIYKVNLGLDGQDFVVNSEIKDVDIGAIEGNANAAMALAGPDIFDVGTVEEARANAAAVTGELYASNAAVQSQRLSYLHKMIIGQIINDPDANYEYQEDANVPEQVRGQCRESACASLSCKNRQPHYWSSGYGFGGYTHENHNCSAYDYKSGGMLLGADWNIESVRTGMFYGCGQTSLDSTQAELHAKDHTFGGYAKWDSRLFGGYTTALGSFSFSDNEGNRFVQNNNSSYRLEEGFSTFEGATYLEKGWSYFDSFGVNVNPYGALQYIGYSAEKMDKDNVIQIGDTDYHSLRTVAGLRLDRDFYRNGRLWNLSTGAAWHHELLDTNASFIATSNFGGAPVSAEVFGSGAGRDWVECTVGTDVHLTNCLTLSADYYLMVNKYSALNAGMGTLVWRF